MHSRKAILTRSLFYYDFQRFVASGLFNTAWGYCLFLFMFRVVGVNYIVANMITYSAGLLASFVMQKKWVFSSTKEFKAEVFPFLVISSSGFCVNLIFLIVLAKYYHTSKEAAQIGGMCGYAFWTYFGNKYWTFMKAKCDVTTGG